MQNDKKINCNRKQNIMSSCSVALLSVQVTCDAMATSVIKVIDNNVRLKYGGNRTTVMLLERVHKTRLTPETTAESPHILQVNLYQRSSH